jgi:hypothetical protein
MPVKNGDGRTHTFFGCFMPWMVCGGLAFVGGQFLELGG